MRKEAEEHDVVMVLCTLKVGDTCFYNGTLNFSVGFGFESHVPDIIDNLVKSMAPNTSKEVSLLTDSLNKADKLFFGITEEDTADATLTISLKKIDKINEVWNMSESEKFANAAALKVRGNQFLKSRQYARSLRVYKLGIRCLEGSASVSPAAFESRHEASANARQLYLTLLTNAALCLLKINISPEGIAPTAGKAPISTSGLMRPCIALCKKALQLDPQNAKAWYRMGQAYAALEDYHEAISAGERAVEALSVSKTSSVKVEEAIAKWRQALVSLNRAEHAHIRSAFLRRATKLRQQGLLFPDDDAGEANRLRFGDWSNDMASDVMSIHEELEAFGERMPDARSVVSRNSRKGGKRGGSCGLTTIDSEDEEEEEDEWGSTK